MPLHLSWKQKFRLLILLVLLGLLLMAASAYRANQRLFEAFEARQAATAFQQASIALLADWRRLDTFHALNGQSADDLERAMASVGEAAGRLAEQGQGLNDAALRDSTRTLVEAMRQNLDLRRQWLQAYRELGLEPTGGERRRLADAAAKLKEIPFGAIQPYIATAITSQANYLATFEAAYAQEARGALDALQKAIADLGWQDNVVGQAATAFAAAFGRSDALIHTLGEQQQRLASEAADIQARVERQAAVLRDGILRASADQAAAARRSALAWLAGGFAVVAGVLLLTLGRASRSLMAHLDRVIALLSAVALGDLTQRLSPGRNERDEFNRLGAASNDMTQGIAAVIRQVIDGNQELSRVHTYLTDAMRQLDRSSGQVESQTAQAASASQQISATVNEMAQRASQVGDATHAALDAARTGATTIVGNADNTRKLSRLIQATHQQIGVLGRSAARVNGIVDVINGLAGQTNLLALNAAIEAARAGEAGRGFSVVADEVRSLAQKTVAATTDIARIVEDLHDQTRKMDDLMVDGLALAEEGERDAGAVAGAIEAITQSMERLGGEMEQIAVSIEEISVTTEDVAAKIEDIDQQTAQTRTLREALDGHAHRLTAQVEVLAASASRFRLA